MARFEQATTQQVKDALKDSRAIVMDARENCAFIGWALDGVARGGHIPGATDFSAAWLHVTHAGPEERAWAESRLPASLGAKGLHPGVRAIVYDANGTDALQVAGYLERNGITDVSVYDVRQWAGDPALPLAVYPGHETLLPPREVDAMLADDCLLFEVGWGEEPPSYLEGHIPGAVYLDTDELEAPPIWKRRPDADLMDVARRYGIDAETPIVLYCRGRYSTAACRIRAILVNLGVRDVRVLNGGLDAWIAAGADLETGSRFPRRGTGEGLGTPARPHFVVDMPEARAALADRSGSSLVDIRTWDEHVGATAGYSEISTAGRPAGARWGGDVYADATNLDGTMRNFAEVLDLWAANGITPDQRLVFFCGTGWRAAEMLTYAEVAGVADISLFDGGWFEWIADGDTVAVGQPTGIQRQTA